MAKVWNKSACLTLILAFLMTAVFPVGITDASDEAKFSKAYSYVTADKRQSAGTITVKPDKDAAGSVQDAVYITITLPEGVEFTTKPAAGDTGAGRLIQGGNTTPKLAASGSKYVKAWVAGSNWDTSNPVPEVKFDFSDRAGGNNRLDIEKGFTGNLDVTVEAAGVKGAAIVWSVSEDLTIAKINKSGVVITADDLKKVPTGNNREVAGITVEESTKGLISGGKTITLRIESDGVEFNSVTAAGEDGISIDSGTRKTDSDGNYTIYEFKVTGESRSFPGAIKFDPVKLDIDPDATGDIEVKVSSDDGDIDDETVTVGVIGDSDLTVTADGETGMEEHMRKASINELWEITIETNGEFEQGDRVTVTLPEHFEFYNKALGYFRSRIGDGADYKGTFEGNQSIWLEINADGDGKDEITLSNLFVGALSDAEYGDINVEIGGDIGQATVKAGLLKPGVIPTPEPTYVVSGHNQLAGKITFTETDKDAIDNGVKFFMTLPNGVEFAAKPTVTVNGEKIDGARVGPGSYGDDVCQITVEKFKSSQIDILEVAGIRYDIEGWFSPGEMIKVRVGGNDPLAEDNFNQFYESLMLGFTAFVKNGIDSWDNFQFRPYADETIVEVPNAIFGAPDQVTAAFKPGDEGVYVENGRTLVRVNLLTKVLGLQKSWDEAAKTAYFVKEGVVAAFPAGQNKINVNGVDMPVDQGAKIINGFTCVTLRGLEMAFGGKLAWDDETKTATFVFGK